MTAEPSLLICAHLAAFSATMEKCVICWRCLTCSTALPGEERFAFVRGGDGVTRPKNVSEVCPMDTRRELSPGNSGKPLPADRSTGGALFGLQSGAKR